MSVSFETWTKVGVILLSLFSGCDLSLLFLSVFKFKPRTLQQKRKKKQTSSELFINYEQCECFSL